MTKHLSVTENVIPTDNFCEFDRRCSRKAVYDAFDDITLAAIGFMDVSMSFAWMHRKSVEDTREMLGELKDAVNRLEKQLGWDYEQNTQTSPVERVWDEESQDFQ